MAKLTKTKAKKILHEGMVRGHELTERQRKFFGARASGMALKKTAAKAARRKPVKSKKYKVLGK